MKIVIDISDDEIYEIAKAGKWRWPANDVYDAIAKGTVLPEKHGRLIDADALKEKYKNCAVFWNKDIDEAPTIIEADMESEDICG